MKLTSTEKQTIKYYDKEAKQWNLTRGGVNRNPVLPNAAKEFKKFLKKGKVLEIGCGMGEDAISLTKLGFEYIGVDISREFIKLARRNFPDIKFVWMSVYELDFPDESFDGFWSSATLLHIPKSKIKTALHEIRRVLKNGAVGWFSLKKGIGEKTDPDTGRLFSYFETKEMNDLLFSEGFEIIKYSENRSGSTLWMNYFIKAI